VADAMPSLLDHLRRRMLTQFRLAFTFAAVGGLAASLVQIPDWVDIAQTVNTGKLVVEIARDLGAAFVAAMVLLFALRLSTDDGVDLLRRPGRFIVLLTAGATLGTVIAFMAHACFKGAAPLPLRVPADRLLYVWLQVMLWGGLVGWLYLLSLQRLSDQTTLALLLGRRVLLERQLSSARLAVARGRVDPAMVARVLGVVHARHAQEPEHAAALLDELIRYLRLAMNRSQSDGAAANAALSAIRTQLEEHDASH